MGSRRGYRVDWPSGLVVRFDSNLNRVPDDLHGTMRTGFEKSTETLEEGESSPTREALKLASAEVGVPVVVEPSEGLTCRSQTFGSGDNTITIAQISQITTYRFRVGIHCFGLDLSLLLTEKGASQAISVARRWHQGHSDSANESTATFFKLPPEMREKIYAFSIPETEWEITDLEAFEATQFPRAIGDPTGFYFPLNEDLGLLGVNKQMREESLPLAYRRTFFKLGDLDDLVKLLVSIGKIGRENVESLECFWTSRAEANLCHLTLPTRHVVRVIDLLKQCERLKFLHVIFDCDSILALPVSALQADPGIRGLSFLRHIERVEIQVSPHERHSAVWLRETLERFIRGGDRG